MAEAKVFGDYGFFYVPREELRTDAGLARHSWLGKLYDPINDLDHTWFGGESANRGCFFRIAP
jgi:hypothetical protein